jgi:hypothetical protein
MAILTALVGSWGRKGGIFLPTAVPRGSVDLPAFPESDRGRADGAGTRFPLASQELGVTNGLVGTTLSGHEAQQVTEQLGGSGRSDRARR